MEPKIRNATDTALRSSLLAGGGRIEPGQLVECPAEFVYSHTASANWEPANKAATDAHKAGQAEEAERVNAELEARGLAAPATDDTEATPADENKGE